MVTEAVGLSRDLPEKRVMRAAVHGTEIVVWRSASGKLAAWSNRCPHRGMRLSHGFVRGEQLACLYHGWHFGETGACKYIPAHPDLKPPETIKTNVYSTVEAQGLIWVSVEGDAAPPDLPKDLMPLRSITISAPEAEIEAAMTATSLEGALPVRAGQALQSSLGPMTSVYGADVEDRTVCHLLVEGDRSLSDKVKISRWIEAVRRRAEESVV